MLSKVETQGSQMELLRQKNKVLLEENRQLQQRVENLERSVPHRQPLRWLCHFVQTIQHSFHLLTSNCSHYLLLSLVAVHCNFLNS